nr:S1C family serine protease [uncultured Sellimonas sp.]
MSAQFQNDDEKKDEKESYSFLKETIKKPPVDKRAAAIKILKNAGLGLIFGLMACVGYTVAKPWAEEHIGNTRTNVTIPQDDQKEEEDAAEEENEQTQTPVLTTENYRQMMEAMNQVAASVEKSMVVITGTVQASDDGQTDSVRQSRSGVIVADNGVEFLILTGDGIFESGKEVTAAFYDGNEASASLKQQDRNLGIAVYAVEKSGLSQNTAQQAAVAVLGNSNLVSVGDPVIAVGSPFGSEDGAGFGTISGTQSQKYLCDGQYQMLETDLVHADGASGVLTDLNGEIVGLIDEGTDGTSGVMKAFAISGLKEEIEMLSNGVSAAYLGISGTEVSDVIADSQDMPKGVYVSSSMPDSPAMQAGIQSGDIITEIGGTKIYTLKGLKDELLDYRPGRQITIKGKRRGSDGYVDVQFDVTLAGAE